MGHGRHLGAAATRIYLLSHVVDPGSELVRACLVPVLCRVERRRKEMRCSGLCWQRHWRADIVGGTHTTSGPPVWTEGGSFRPSCVWYFDALQKAKVTVAGANPRPHLRQVRNVNVGRSY